MQSRPLGRSGLSIPPLVLGGNVFGWTADRAQSFRILDAALDYGLTAIDTADMYSAWVPGNQGGESETIIGEWLTQRGNRDRITLFTKVGMAMGDGRKGLSPDWIRHEIEASLRRLKTDHVDLYQAHQDDPDTPLEETLETFAALIREGKVRALGASNYTADRLREALDVSEKHKLPRYESLQPHYNLIERSDYESGLEKVAADAGLGVIPYYALASGFLTGKYRSEADLKDRARADGVRAYVTSERGQKILGALDAVSSRHDVNPTQVALAWAIARPSITAPIVSASRPEQIADLARAGTLSLTADDIKALDEASA